MLVVPTIIEKDFNEAERKINLVKELVAWVQIDVIDGILVEGKTFELELLGRPDTGWENLLFETHLMVKEPVNWMGKAIHAGASRVIGHTEMMRDRVEFINKIKQEGLEAGLAYDWGTELDEEIPAECDVVLLMARQMGFGSKKFEEGIYRKIEKLINIRKKSGLNFVIGVDGGIRENEIKVLAGAGVGLAYCGAAVFNGKVEDNLWKLKKQDW